MGLLILVTLQALALLVAHGLSLVIRLFAVTQHHQITFWFGKMERLLEKYI
jgi:hypothetical protein